MKQYYGEVKEIRYSLLNGIGLSFDGGWGREIYYTKPEDISFGGKNGEIGSIVIGSKLEFEIVGNGYLKNVTILSDGIREVDTEGNLIKW